VGDWQRSLNRLFELGGVPDAHAHRFRDTFSVELLLAGVPIERVSILLGHQSMRITEKHYAPWVKARQEQLEADVRRTWPKEKRQREVHGGYTGAPAQIIPFESRRKNGGGGGVGIFRLVVTLNLLILRDAKNAEHGRIAANWNVSGTRDFQPAVQICEEFTSPLSTSYPRVTFACRPNFPEGRFTGLMLVR